MATVTIRGSITPSARLPRGEVITVQDTPSVRAFIAAGWADLVEEHGTPEEARVVSPEPPVDPPTPPADQPATDPDQPTTTPYTLDKPPSKGGSREDWAEFLASFPKVGIVTEGKTRDQLVGEWETWQDEHAAPAQA